MDTAFNQEIAQQLQLFGSHNPSLDQSQRDLLAGKCVKSQVPLNPLTDSDSIFQHQVLTETKTVDFYLRQYFPD